MGEGSSSGDVYDNTSYSENNDDDEYCSNSDGSDGSASETESSWTPTILAEEMRYREKGMGADDSEMMKEESYDEVDMLLMGFEQGLDERFAGALAFKKTNEMCTRKTWALFLATWMAAVFGIDAPNRLWRAWSILLSASFLMVTVFQIHSLIAEFNDIKYGTILLLAMLWFLLVTLASATFSLRMWKHKGWLFGTWRLLWESEHCVKGSARRLSFIITLILLAVVGNSFIITAARWVNVEEVANKVFRELLVSRYALFQALFSLIWVLPRAPFYSRWPCFSTCAASSPTGSAASTMLLSTTSARSRSWSTTLTISPHTSWWSTACLAPGSPSSLPSRSPSLSSASSPSSTWPAWTGSPSPSLSPGPLPISFSPLPSPSSRPRSMQTQSR